MPKLLIYGLLVLITFYLPIRFMFSEGIMFLPDSIVLFLVLGYFFKRLYGKKKKGINYLDLFFFIFLFYSISLLGLSLLKGGGIIFLKHFHNFIPGIIMYIIIREFLEDSDSSMLLQIYIIVSTIVAIVYIFEWVNMNMLNKNALSWVSNYQKDFGVGDQFLNKGHLGFIRPMGLIGYSHATGIFIGGGIIILFSRVMNYNKKKINYLFLGISIIAVILTASRTAIIGVLFSILLVVWNSKVNVFNFFKNNIIAVTLSLAFVGIIITQYLGELPEYAQLKMFLYLSLGDSEYGASIFESFLTTIPYEFLQLSKIIEDFPLALFTGAGYPVYFSNNTLNPIITNETYFLMWITQYGVFGCVIVATWIFLLRKRIFNNLKNPLLSLHNRYVLLSIYGVMFLFLFSTIHSASIQFYPIYFWLFTLMGMVGNKNWIPKIKN
jgi:hypothetical protein